MEPCWPWSEWRCFRLERSPRDGAAALDRNDEQHLARVLRARPGERILGLDGQGAAWPLRIASVDRRNVQLEPDGEPFVEPAPGEVGARVGRVELAVAWPRPQVAEEMFDGLVQLGCARVTALVGARSQDWARDWTPARRERLERISREACKQARRLWAPQLDGPMALEEWLAERATARTVLLEPRAQTTLEPWVRAQAPGSAEDPLRLLVGPEGGWSEGERAACAAAGLAEARIEAFVLRTQLAAQLGVAIALQRTRADSPSAPTGRDAS